MALRHLRTPARGGARLRRCRRRRDDGRRCGAGALAGGPRDAAAGVPASAAAAGRERRPRRARPRAVLRAAALRLRQDGVRELPFPGARLGRDRREEPQRFRQAHVAQVAAADRDRACRRRAGRLGRPQPDARGAGQGLDRDRLDVDARHRRAGEGRGHRGAHPLRPGLCGAIRRGAARRKPIDIDAIVDGDRRLRAHARARPGAVRRLGRGRRGGDPGGGKARLRALCRPSQLLCLPRRLALHRRQVPRHRHDDDRSAGAGASTRTR